MFICFQKFFNTERIVLLSELESQFQQVCKTTPLCDLRKSIEILVIDDEEFKPERNLRNLDFNLTVFKDISRVEQVKNYDIILCDVNGVGLELSDLTQGAFLIDEIKKNYKSKIVISYTAGSQSSELVFLARQYSDGDIRKDAPIEDWRNLLDDFIENLSNPIYQWKRERLQLLDNGMELNDLRNIVQLILKILNQGADVIRNKIISAYNIKQSNLNDSKWKQDLQNFLYSKVFDLAFNAMIGGITQ